MMTEAAVKAPVLRFDKFDDELPPIKLLAVCNGEISNGVFNDPNKRNGNYRLVNVLDMFGTDQIDVDALSFLDLDQKEFEKNKVKFGDIFFTRSSLVPAGIAWSNVFLSQDENVTFDGHLMKISPDLQSFSPAFLAQYFRSTPIRKQLIVRGKTGTMTTIGQSDIATVEVRTPTLPEQQKIADFLTAVDGRIGQLVQKKALLEDYKKGVMQQLFTQAIRFNDDHGNDFPDWEEKKLGELTKWASGGTPSKDNASFWEGDIPWMSAASMHERYYGDSPLKITDEGVKAGSKIALKGTLLLLVRGSMLWNRIPVGITTRDVAFNQDVKALAPTNKILAEFLLQWFIASENILLHKVVGTGIGAGKLDTDEMKRLSLRLPSPDEQTKIADFLSTIDRKIENVATQITETQTFKKGLLQQMFV